MIKTINQALKEVEDLRLRRAGEPAIHTIEVWCEGILRETITLPPSPKELKPNDDI
jgi:hypothetical protein